MTDDLDLQRVMVREPEERDLIRILGKCTALRPESALMRRVCENLARAGVGVLTFKRGRYSLTGKGSCEYRALVAAGSLDLERVWKET
jgi:hypothetical protein